LYILYGRVEIFLPYAVSLKHKRQSIQSTVARTKKRFNSSICESEFHDLWQRSALGFSAACSQYAENDLMLNALRETLDQHDDVCEVISFVHYVFQFNSDERQVKTLPTNDEAW